MTKCIIEIYFNYQLYRNCLLSLEINVLHHHQLLHLYNNIKKILINNNY